MKRHRLDHISLVFGILFAGLGAMYFLGAFDPAAFRFNWLMAVVLIGLGLVMVLSPMSRDDEGEQRAGDD